MEKENIKERETEHPESVPCAEGVSLFGRVMTKGRINVMSMIICGQIEGHSAVESPAKSTKYEHIIPELVFCDEKRDIDGVLFLINTVGGDVEAGLAIAEMIRGMRKPTVSLVLGGGHSIGLPLAVAAKYSFIAKSATVTVHPVRVNGTVLGAVQSFEYLRKMQDRICDFIEENSKVERRTLDELMRGRSDMATDIGTILDGEGAVAAGLIDEVGTFRDAMDKLEALAAGNT